jgi:hypothetical protein
MMTLEHGDALTQEHRDDTGFIGANSTQFAESLTALRIIHKTNATL